MRNQNGKKHLFVCLFASNGGSMSSSCIAILLRDEQNPNSRVLNAGSGKHFMIAPSKPNSKGFETFPGAEKKSVRLARKRKL